MENDAQLGTSATAGSYRSPAPALSPGRHYDIHMMAECVLRAGLCGVFGVLGTIGFTVKSLRAYYSSAPLNDVPGVVFSVVLICWAVSTLREPFALCVTTFGALKLKRLLGSVVIMPHEIHTIRTATRKFPEEGADARIIEITYRGGHISIGNFTGAEAVFTQLLLMYPHIREVAFDFTPDIRD